MHAAIQEVKDSMFPCGKRQVKISEPLLFSVLLGSTASYLGEGKGVSQRPKRVPKQLRTTHFFAHDTRS